MLLNVIKAPCVNLCEWVIQISKGLRGEIVFNNKSKRGVHAAKVACESLPRALKTSKAIESARTNTVRTPTVC